MQRLYVEEWVNVVLRMRTDLNDGEARAAVHAVMAFLESAADRRSGLPCDEVAGVLCRTALAALCLPDSSDGLLT